METVIQIIHVFVAIGIIGLVLIQHGKGADAGAAFGAGAAGGASGSVFGAKGSGNFLSRTTAILATVFFLTSLSLAYFTRGSEAPAKSLLDSAPAKEVMVPAAPVTNDIPKPMASDVPASVPEVPVAPGPLQGKQESLPAGTSSEIPPAPANNKKQ